MNCEKVKYHSKMNATNNIIQQLRKSKSGMLRPYYCRYCKVWHLTSKKKKGVIDTK